MNKIRSQEQLHEMRETAENLLRKDLTYKRVLSNERQQPSDQISKKLSQAEQDRLFNVRRSFQESLSKLSKTDTKEVGINECKKIIDSNFDQHCLRIYLSLLCEKHKNATTSNKELQVLLFGHLAKVYKQDFLDPLDKPPNLLKTIVRVCENIHSFLKENSTIIHLACSNSLLEILEHCFP